VVGAERVDRDEDDITHRFSDGREDRSSVLCADVAPVVGANEFVERLAVPFAGPLDRPGDALRIRVAVLEQAAEPALGPTTQVDCR